MEFILTSKGGGGGVGKLSEMDTHTKRIKTYPMVKHIGSVSSGKI